MAEKNTPLRQLPLGLKTQPADDLTGRKYGHWTVLKRAGKDETSIRWLCRCRCGTIRDVSGKRLKRGRTRSCGCSTREDQPRQCEPGQRYGRLIILQQAQSGKWLCQCDCGESKPVGKRELQRGDTRSCGCLAKSGNAATQTADAEAAINKLYRDYKRSAEKRRISFHLTRKMVRKLATKPCHYCGKPPELKNPTGIDRVDNTKGYLTENVVPCCGICNLAKNRLTVEQFLEWVKRIYNHQFPETIQP